MKKCYMSIGLNDLFKVFRSYEECMFPKFKKFYIIKCKYMYSEYTIKWMTFDPKTKQLEEY